MKTLVCGIVGAAAAVAAWLVLEVVTQQEFGWMAVLVGLVTGFAMHMAAGTHARESYARGALAALLALGACVGGPRLKVEYMQSRADAADVAAVKVDIVETDGGESTVAEAADELAIVEEAPDPRMDAGKGIPEGAMNLKKPSLKQWDMLWLCLAALAAYVTGKGWDKQPPAAAQQPPAEPPQEGQASE